MAPLALALTVVLQSEAAGQVVEDLSDSQADAPTAERWEPFVGFNVGAAYYVVDHPNLKAGFAAPTLSLMGGFHATEQVSFSLEVQSAARWIVHRPGPNNPSPYTAGAGCSTCMPPPRGGIVGAVTATFTTLGPRIDFSPWGRQGPFAGASVGVAYIQGLPTESPTGVAASAHLGARLRVLKIVELGVEAGVYGQRYSDAGLWSPYCSGNIHLHM